MLDKIFNVIKTEPAMVTAVVQAILGVIVSFGFSLTADETGAIMAVTTALLGLVTAVSARPFAVSALTGLVSAVVTLLVAFGVHGIQPNTVVSVNAAIVKDIITQLIGAIWGTHSFEALSFKVHGSTFDIGDLVNAIIYFLIVAAVVYFLVVKPMGSLMARRNRHVEVTTRDCPECLSSIPLAASRCMYCTAQVPPVTQAGTPPLR